jgi:MoaA/NifB/PqqE/SkfB family radical SAM enzyme
MTRPFSVTTETLSTHGDPGQAPAEAGPWRLTLVTNPDDCNLACDMCECGVARAGGGPPAAPRRMAVALALAVLDERRGSALAEVIPSTMGEPLLWAGLDALLDRCVALGLAVNVTTNGTFPGRGAAAWASRLVPVASDVKVSWNGATAATAAAIMPGLDLGRAVGNVAALVAARDAHARAGGRRCGITFQVTAQERNVGELAGIVRLAARLGVDRVKLNHLQPRRPALEGRSLRRSAEALRRWNAAVREARAAAEEAALAGAGVRLENAAPLAEDPADPAPRGPCRFVGREAWIHPDGRFAPCPHPAAAGGGLGDFGSVASAPLGALWAGAAFRAFVANHAQHPVCRACPLRRPGGA